MPITPRTMNAMMKRPMSWMLGFPRGESSARINMVQSMRAAKAHAIFHATMVPNTGAKKR